MYKRIFTEEEGETPEVIFDKKVTAILKTLRDENFRSEEARKKFVDLISSLNNSKDKRARLSFKKIGDFFSEIGDELLKYGEEE